ncbi:MAG: DUF4340 domain-containing protein [Verrucomicrobium sp.]|nr:DUF4340 domain-containing protein [Verrucomicrobium sp.]
MKASTTIILLVLVGGLVAFIASYEHKLPSTSERIARENRPFAIPAEKVDAIQITTKESSVSLVRSGNVWQVKAPFQDRANPELIATLLTTVNSLEWRDTVARKDQSKEDYKRTGLGGGSVMEVKIMGDRHILAHCRVGGKAPFEESYYITQPPAEKDAEKTKEQDELLHVAKTPLPTLLAKRPEEWRDSKLIRIPAESVHRFVLTAGTGAIEFTRTKGRPWQLVKPLQTPASDERVNAVLAAVLNLQVQVNNQPDSAPKGTDPSLPPMTVTVEAEGQTEPTILTLLPVEPGQPVPAQASSRPGRFLAPAKLSDFWKLQPNHLRDQQLARIAVNQVTSVRLRSLALPEVVLDLEGGGWTLKRFGKKELGNQERIQALLDGLNGTTVKSFVADNASGNLEPYGLDRPFLEIQWTAGDKTEVLQFGQGSQGGVVSAKYKDEPSIFQVNPFMLSIAPPEMLKWRSGRVVTANLFAVRRIIVAEGSNPALTLNYASVNDSWTGELAGQDITSKLNTAQANQLLNLMVNFDAVEWSTNRTASIEALKNPSLTLQLLLGNPADASAAPEPVAMSFAPATLANGQKPILYYGRLNNEPDTFLISRETYEILTTPILKAE